MGARSPARSLSVRLGFKSCLWVILTSLGFLGSLLRKGQSGGDGTHVGLVGVPGASS